MPPPLHFSHDESHGAHVISVVAVHAATSNVPAPQVAQAMHVPPNKNVPVGQVPQSAAVGPVQDVHDASQVAQTVSCVGVQWSLSNEPGAQVVHRSQPLPASKKSGAHAVQSRAPGPVHVAHAESHAAHWVFVELVHDATSNEPTLHVAHALHDPSLRYSLAAQERQSVADGPEQVAHWLEHQGQEPPSR